MKFKSTIILLISSFSVIVFFQLLNLFIAHRFPKLDAGFFFTLFSLCKVVNLLTDFGSTTYYKREWVTSADSTGSFNSLITARFILSFSIVATLALLACLYYNDQSVYFIIAVFFYHLFEHCNNFLIGLVQAKNKFREQLVSIVVFFIMFLFAFGCIYGLKEIHLLSILLCLVFAAAGQLVYLVRSIAFVWTRADFTKLFSGLRVGYHIGMFEIISSLGARMIPVILYHSYASYVGAFSLVNMILMGLILLPTAIFAAFYTDLIRNIESRNSILSLRFKFGNLFFLVAGFTVALIMYFLFADIIDLILGHKYTSDIELIEFYFFIAPFMLVNNFQNLLLLAFGRNQQVMKINLVHFICATMAFIVLLQVFGLRGALLSNVVIEIAFSIIRYLIVNDVIRRNLSQTSTNIAISHVYGYRSKTVLDKVQFLSANGYSVVGPRKIANNFSQVSVNKDAENVQFRRTLGNPMSGTKFIFLSGRLQLNKKTASILVEAEPWSLVFLQVMLYRFLFARQASLTLFTWENFIRPGIKGNLISFFYKLAIRNCSTIVCGNRAGKEIFEQFGATPGQVQIKTQFGVNPGDFGIYSAEIRSGLREKYLGNKSGKFVIGYAGRLVPEKGILDLRDAFLRLYEIRQDIHLFILGTGPLQHELVGSAGITVLDAVSQDEVPGFLNCMDLFVLPSRSTHFWVEQFGRVLIESMACGVPVIGSDSGEIPHVIGDEDCIFSEGDVDGLCALLARLARKDDFYCQVRTRQQERIPVFYNNKVYNDLLQMIKNDRA